MGGGPGSGIPDSAESIIKIDINGQTKSALLDTGASENFIDTRCVKIMGLQIKVDPYGIVALADKKHKTKTTRKSSR